MRKILKIGKHQQFLLKKSRKLNRREKLLLKGFNTKRYRAYKQLKKKYSHKIKFWDKERRKFYESYYSPIKYDGGVKTVNVGNQIGSEFDIEYFADVGERLIEGNDNSILINLLNCKRVWPSAVMLFCSFMQWTVLKADESYNSPKVSSTGSNFDDVSSYLDFCGFHDYVKRKKTGKKHHYKTEEIVKIQREKDGKSFSGRFDEISKLVKETSTFDSDDLEEFKSCILGEILINVTEHGVNYKDMGWYTLSQVHATSGFLSLNFADNGIGIPNSLKTGPQKTNLSSGFDHDYILEAFKVNVSGAFTASTQKKGVLVKKYKVGPRRGSGLKYILDSCKSLGIQLSVVSGRGYVQYDKHGKLVVSRSRDKVVFAGTLYNLRVPIKDSINGS